MKIGNGIGRCMFVAGLVCLAVGLSACGGVSDSVADSVGGGSSGGGSTPPVPATGLNQAAWESGTTNYVYGHNSIPNIPISGAPADADFTRWAMLHDGTTYRLYFFKQGSNDTLYQFGYNPATTTYEYGFNSIPTLQITGAPAEADPSSFAMLHDGSVYRLYMRGLSDPRKLYQFGWDGSTYAYGHMSIPVLDTTSAPVDADFSRWAMLHDGGVYRQYVAKAGSADTLYQFGWNGGTYEYGHMSIPQLSILGMPANSRFDSFAMLHDGGDYRFYHLAD